MKQQNTIIDFINRRFKGDSHWCDGNCYYFAVILKNRFPLGAIYYEVVDGHFIFKYNNRYYDWTGEVAVNTNYIVEWDRFDEYDHLQKKRIIGDCIL